ncbi:MAG: hypothetical protein WCO23_05015 [bacterium]
MTELWGINDPKLLGPVGPELAPPKVNIENFGYQSLTVAQGMITDKLKSWGFSTEEINNFKIVFRPAVINDSKFQKMLVQGFYQKKPDGSRYIEIYTTIPVKNEEDQNFGVAVKEDVIQRTLAHELRHAMQDRAGVMEQHPIAETDEEHEDNLLESDARAYAEDNLDEFKGMVRCGETSGPSDGLKDSDVARIDDSVRPDIDTEKSYLMNESHHPARTWSKDVDDIVDSLENGEVDSETTIDKYNEIFDRGKNMMEAGSLGHYEFQLKMEEATKKINELLHQPGNSSEEEVN